MKRAHVYENIVIFWILAVLDKQCHFGNSQIVSDDYFRLLTVDGNKSSIFQSLVYDFVGRWRTIDGR